jgi:hypothetical protein
MTAAQLGTFREARSSYGWAQSRAEMYSLTPEQEIAEC